MVEQIRSKGHIVALLDPLRRPGVTGRGPFFQEKNQYVWGSDATHLLGLVEGYPEGAPLQVRTEYLSDKLGLQGSVDPGRRWFVNGALTRGARDGEQEGGLGGLGSSSVMERSTAGAPGGDMWLLPELFEFMTRAYCRTLTTETTHLHTNEQSDWMHRRLENRTPVPRHIKRDILYSLMRAHTFETTLQRHFPASKRFGIEGCEAVIPGLEALVRHAGEMGVSRIEMGMAHRGRLNVLHNVLGKPMGMICSEMDGAFSDVHVGDVKYHLGNEGRYKFFPSWMKREGGAQDTRHIEDAEGGTLSPQDHESVAEVAVSLAPNPSHLEAINPVVLGMVRAQQQRLRTLRTDQERRSKIMGLLIHGDASFSGLGSVFEALSLTNVPGYTVGGTVHVVINNQVGFTTLPRDSRSSLHPTDVAKSVGAAVLHANADDPEAVWQACEMALEFRAQFQLDAVVDVVGFRRHGHNELEDPTPTMPLTYKAVAGHPPTVETYKRRLLAEGVVTEDEVEAWQEALDSKLQAGYEAHVRGEYHEAQSEWVTRTWQASALASIAGEGDDEAYDQESTGLPLPTLQWVGSQLCRLPEGFTAHPTVTELYAKRRRMVEGPESRVDWAMAEALAFGTLSLRRGVFPPQWKDMSPEDKEKYKDPTLGLNKGHYEIRLSGQDVERGTFNQRHFAAFDQRTAEKYLPLSNISTQQEPVMLFNSTLNEGGTLGFEYGYSLGMRRRGLTIWEAQFGDFANNAQVIIDQFIASAEEKWGQESNLVLLLPHGFDGQGPDHSSGRIERFLGALNDDPDHLPGASPDDLKLITETFEHLTDTKGEKPFLTREDVMSLLREQGLDATEAVEIMWEDLALPADAHVTQEHWQEMMTSYLRRSAERNANMFVLMPSTPAQYFHALRRQVNLPFAKPCVIFSPKYLLHHRPCSSALQDLENPNFFHRIIDDNSAGDNTRHQGVNPKTGERYLLPPDEVRRVIICSGQMYYKLSLARKAQKVRDIKLIRLEQIAPFPHDKLTSILHKYGNAEIMWCQEEPKNMGAWNYVKPRLVASMKDHCARQERPQRNIVFCGRASSASPATASLSIHLKETREIIAEALRLDPAPC